MRRNGMPMAMWAVFAKSFEKQLTEVFGYDAKTAKAIRKTAKLKYKEIIAKLPEFEKGDRFSIRVRMKIPASLPISPSRPTPWKPPIIWSFAMRRI